MTGQRRVGGGWSGRVSALGNRTFIWSAGVFVIAFSFMLASHAGVFHEMRGRPARRKLKMVLHMCSKANWTDLHLLTGFCKNNNKTHEDIHHRVTSSIYITTAALCLLLSTVTQLKYNSVKVLNVTVRSKVISNIPWITYFIVLFIRSVVGAVITLCYDSSHSSHKTRLTAYFIADGALKSLEVLCLLWALNHQRIYRSGGFMQQEINSFNSDDLSSSSQHGGFSAAARTLRNSKTEAVFMAQFIFAILFMILLEEPNKVNKEEPGLFYWIYMFFFWTQCISTVVLAVLIAANRNEDGPTFVVKLLFIAGVVFTLPGDIPSFIWSTCLKCPRKPWHFLTAYDIALFLSIPSIITFFVVLRTEFHRLDQEAQYRVIGGEVDSLFSVHSETIAEN